MADQNTSDAFVRRQTYLERFGRGLSSRILLVVNGDKLNKILRNKRMSNTQKSRAITKEVKRLRGQSSKVLTKELKALYKQELKWLDNLVKETIKTPTKKPITIINEAINTPLIVNNGATPKQGYEKAWTSLDEGVTNTARSLEYGIVTADEAVSQLKHSYRQFKRNLDTSTRTAAFSVTNGMRHEVYKANTDIIRSVVFSAVLDGRTTAYCMSIDGNIVPVDDPTKPPFHYNCRTIALPVLSSETDEDARGSLKQRSSIGPGEGYVEGDNTLFNTKKNRKDKKVDVSEKGYQRYSGFLASQVGNPVGEEFIRDTMGRKKGNRFIRQVNQGMSPQVSLIETLKMKAKELDIDGLKRRSRK